MTRTSCFTAALSPVLSKYCATMNLMIHLRFTPFNWPISTLHYQVDISNGLKKAFLSNVNTNVYELSKHAYIYMYIYIYLSYHP